MSWPSTVSEFVFAQFQSSPAEWTTALLLLATLAFSVWLTWSGRKRVLVEHRIEHYTDGNQYYLRATNTSTNRDIELIDCGFVYWNGKVHTEHNFYSRDDYRQKPEQYREFFFADANGDRLRFHHKDVYRFYVQDASKKYYYGYTLPQWMAHPKRFFIWLLNLLQREKQAV